MALRHRFRVPAARTSLAIAVLTTMSAHASGVPAGQPATLDTVVVTASGFEQKITDAPASISVITREELARRPYMTLLDAVRDLEGVDVGETRDKTGQGTISMRGMGSDYTLILVNGRRQNNHGDIYPNNFGGNQFNHIPPLDAIERIEVIRGPMSTLYGADAMGGVINIITKRTLDGWHGSASVARTVETSDEFGDDSTMDFFLTGPLLPGVLNLSARGSWYDRKASNPTYAPVTDPAGGLHTRPLGFGSGGKTVDNTNKAGGITLTWMPTDNQTVSLDYDASRQEYDNRIKLNDSGVEEYPVGTVDNINSVWRASNFCLGAAGANANACRANGGSWARRADPRVGYSPSQEFTRDAWALTHEGQWDFGNSFVSLAHVATNNDGRTLPFTVAEREQLLAMIDGTGQYAGMGLAERRALAESTFLPRPKRTLESAQYTLDAKLDIPFQAAGEHTLVVGTQVIRGELTDGVFGTEKGTPGLKQEHDMYSLFVEDNWKVSAPLTLTAGLRYDDHAVFGDHLSPRLYGVYALNGQWTVKGGVSTGFKTPLGHRLMPQRAGQAARRWRAVASSVITPLIMRPRRAARSAAYLRLPFARPITVVVSRDGSGTDATRSLMLPSRSRPSRSNIQPQISPVAPSSMSPVISSGSRKPSRQSGASTPSSPIPTKATSASRPSFSVDWTRLCLWRRSRSSEEETSTGSGIG